MEFQLWSWLPSASFKILTTFPPLFHPHFGIFTPFTTCPKKSATTPSFKILTIFPQCWRSSCQAVCTAPFPQTFDPFTGVMEFQLSNWCPALSFKLLSFSHSFSTPFWYIHPLFTPSFLHSHHLHHPRHPLWVCLTLWRSRKMFLWLNGGNSLAWS